jgi:hypothetical protein
VISKRGALKLRTILDRWSAALKHSAEEHGRPNSFGVVELAAEFNLKRRDGYRIGRTRLYELWQWLGGRDRWGSAPTYEKGRFYV